MFGSSRPSADASEGPCVVEVILHLEVPATATKESRICFCSSSFSSAWNLKFSSRVCEASRILRSNNSSVCTLYQVHLRRSNEFHQEIKCWEAQGRQQTPRKVHALLRSFCSLRYLLLPQRKAESVSVLHPLVLREIWSSHHVFVKLAGFLRSNNSSVCTLYQVHLRRSNELHQEIQCWEAQGRQQTPRKVHALLRSFCTLRYLLLPQRKAESVSVLHPSVLCEIWSFRQVFVKLAGF